MLNEVKHLYSKDLSLKLRMTIMQACLTHFIRYNLQ